MPSCFIIGQEEIKNETDRDFGFEYLYENSISNQKYFLNNYWKKIEKWISTA